MPDTTSNKTSKHWRPRTKAVHGGSERSQFGETSEALFLTSGYVYRSAEEAAARFKGEDDGFIYSRFSNPTVGMFEQRMAELEGAEAAWATATGMAAVSSSLLAMLRAGDHVVAARALFGSCRYIVEEMLPRFGIQSTLIDGRDLAQWQGAVRPNTKVLFLESPTNPNLQVSDLRGV
ncbi:MAG: PLP-dependent transferase, partial [Alphaproteobacteria bacterium]|nr:PLP-dependent transferase [Alphaproteobacteria bacterium]